MRGGGDGGAEFVGGGIEAGHLVRGEEGREIAVDAIEEPWVSRDDDPRGRRPAAYLGIHAIEQAGQAAAQSDQRVVDRHIAIAHPARLSGRDEDGNEADIVAANVIETSSGVRTERIKLMRQDVRAGRPQAGVVCHVETEPPRHPARDSHHRYQHALRRSPPPTPAA